MGRRTFWERERDGWWVKVCATAVCVYACMFSSHELAKNTLGLKRLNVETVALISSIPRYGVNTHISDSLFKVAHTHPRHFFFFLIYLILFRWKLLAFGVFLLCLANHPEVVWIQKKKRKKSSNSSSSSSVDWLDAGSLTSLTSLTRNAKRIRKEWEGKGKKDRQKERRKSVLLIESKESRSAVHYHDYDFLELPHSCDCDRRRMRSPTVL
jgi:hypothetical protein